MTQSDRTAEAVDTIRKELQVSNSHITLRNSNVRDVHIVSYDSDDPEHADVHFSEDCPGEGNCPRWHPNG